MAGTYMVGETKVRPGTYFNITKNEVDTQPEVIDGVTAVIFKADYGPLCSVVELSAESGYENVYGTGGTTDAIREAFAGGAKTILACRVGKGGTKASVKLKDTSDADAVTISALYPGAKEFSVTVREKLTNSSMKECIIYAGTTEFERVQFAAGEGEAAALVTALASSKQFGAELADGADKAVLQNLSQGAFTAGTNPETTVDDYSDAFAQVESCEFNTICVDTEDTAVHALLQSFISRVFDAGLLVQAVVAEKHTVDLETRKSHAVAFNDEKMCYVLNAHVNEQGRELDGYQTAARIAGMIGAYASNQSLTHAVITGFSEILERLTNTQMIIAELEGCLVLSYNSQKQVWIDSAINTLVTPADNQDAGWNKIRRVKTRFELIRRLNATADALIGQVDNDTNGRSTVVSQLQAIGDTMVSEGKLNSCVVSENADYTADTDSAWFVVDVVDKDSLEHIYINYRFQFSTNFGTTDMSE